jgi:hypothetical protein
LYFMPLQIILKSMQRPCVLIVNFDQAKDKLDRGVIFGLQLLINH